LVETSLLREDPEGVERKELERVASFRGKDVLEIGCGDGRLTFQYAESANKVVAIDPSRKAISEARKNIPRRLASKIRFRVGRGESLSLPNETFDVVFFSWSLCCADVPAMGRAVENAWRVLRRNGLLLNIQASLHQPFHKGMVTYVLKRGSGEVDWTEGESQARLALRHASFVERRFDFVAEEVFPVYGYYDTVREAIRDITAQEGVKYAGLNRETRRSMNEILCALKTKRGVRVQENAVLTVLRKTYF